jgi:hypothetical protein
MSPCLGRRKEPYMRVLKIEEGKATIEIDGDEMCIIGEGLNSMKDKTCFGADRIGTLINDISAIYSISTYHKIPQMKFTPRVTLTTVNTVKEGREE